eukprot:9264797-Lingulodinium_polyedra.AAC.1
MRERGVGVRVALSAAPSEHEGCAQAPFQGARSSEGRMPLIPPCVRSMDDTHNMCPSPASQKRASMKVPK